MIKDMDDFEVLLITDETETIVRDVLIVPKGTEVGCDENELSGKVARWRPLFCSEASEVKRVLAWCKLR